MSLVTVIMTLWKQRVKHLMRKIVIYNCWVMILEKTNLSHPVKNGPRQNIPSKIYPKKIWNLGLTLIDQTLSFRGLIRISLKILKFLILNRVEIGQKFWKLFPTRKASCGSRLMENLTFHEESLYFG